MPRISLVNLAQQQLSTVLRPGDMAIDATVGNGHDTLFLLEKVTATGYVYGFDKQAAAIEKTQMKMGTCANLTLIEASHAEMEAHIPASLFGKINACMFNLGYLPGGDKSIITQTDSTLTALTVACRLLSNGGMLTILAYPGHHGGDQETRAVIDWCRQLDDRKFSVKRFETEENKASDPRLFVISKIN